MIVRMKELWLFTTSKSVDSTVEGLGELGVVDIKVVQETLSPEVERCRSDINRAKLAISLLEDYVANNKVSKHKNNHTSKDPKRLVERILKTTIINENAQATLEELSVQADWYNTWGKNLDLKDFAYLEDHGIYVRMYLVEKSTLQEIENENLVSFTPINGKIPIALFSRDPEEKLELKEIQIPSFPYHSVEERIKRKQRQLIKIGEFLADRSGYLPLLKDYLSSLEERLESQAVVDGMGDIQGKVKYIKGYLPNDKVSEFEDKARLLDWGYKIEDPENPDDVPVYIKNPKWIEIINPMMKFIDIVPGYKEVDVSIYFLVAFAIFFAMLVGDAGYGLLFLIITFLMRKKIPGQICTLIYVLSGATVVWGVFSGTYFGSTTIASLPILNDLIIPNIASFGVDNISFMMHLSFLIGAIHLTLAHTIRALQFANSIKILSEIGWILLVWGLYFVTEQLVLGNHAPDWYIWLFVVGTGLVVFFTKESNTLLKSIGASISNLPLSLISGFSDIVSYVRLFAVGMATAAVASSFNNMVLPDGVMGMGIFQLILAAIALILGHTLNIALALMAVMVHGIRLNMLEFAGHLGVQFSGEAYNPFTINKRSTTEKN